MIIFKMSWKEHRILYSSHYGVISQIKKTTKTNRQKHKSSLKQATDINEYNYTV